MREQQAQAEAASSAEAGASQWHDDSLAESIEGLRPEGSLLATQAGDGLLDDSSSIMNDDSVADELPPGEDNARADTASAVFKADLAAPAEARAQLSLRHSI